MSWVVHQAQAFLHTTAWKNCDLAADVTARLVLTSPEGADFAGWLPGLSPSWARKYWEAQAKLSEMQKS